MTAKINNITIPTTIANRGKYNYQPPAILGVNGAGAAITSPYAAITWQFA